MNGPNPLDLQTIILYNTTVSKESMDFFIDLMQSLDDAFFEATAKKQKRKEQSKRGK
jgi:hypothetical protein